MANIDLLIVLGMHRSGSSVLSGCLNFLGINLGQSMMPPSKSNSAGYWENNDLVSVHDILLRDLGCNWHLVGALPDGWLESGAADRARKSIKRLIEYHYLGKGLWAVKDPRMCRLMPLWVSILEEMGFSPGFILTVRHPLEVAGSLARRDKFSIRKGLLLWLLHNRDSLDACQGRPHTVHTYDQLLADPVTTLRNIGNNLGLNFPRSVANACADILDFVQPGLKTQHYSSITTQDDKEHKNFTNLFQQIRHACLTDSTPEFPFLTMYPSGSQPDIFVSMFNYLLAYVGDQERDWFSLETRKTQRVLDKTSPEKTLMAQVFFPRTNCLEYAEESSKSFVLVPDQWQELTCNIPDPEVLVAKRLRFDPLNTNGVINISSIKLVNKATGEALFQANNPGDFQNCEAAGHAFVLPYQENFTIFSYNFDPQLFLPLIPNMPDYPLELKVWVKLTTNQAIIRDLWEKMHERLGETLKIEEQMRSGQAGLKVMEHNLEGAKNNNADFTKKTDAQEKEITPLAADYYSKIQRSGSS